MTKLIIALSRFGRAASLAEVEEMSDSNTVRRYVIRRIVTI